jgi:hypothetical protein
VHGITLTMHTSSGCNQDDRAEPSKSSADTAAMFSSRHQKFDSKAMQGMTLTFQTSSGCRTADQFDFDSRSKVNLVSMGLLQYHNHTCRLLRLHQTAFTVAPSSC